MANMFSVTEIKGAIQYCDKNYNMTHPWRPSLQCLDSRSSSSFKKKPHAFFRW